MYEAFEPINNISDVCHAYYGQPTRVNMKAKLKLKCQKATEKIYRRNII